MNAPTIRGLLAEFANADALLSAVRRAAGRGYRLDAYTPFPVEGLADALGFRATALPLIVFLGGVLGGLGGFALQWYSAVMDYPINSGGRPLDSWPAFIPATCALVILGASFAAVFGMLLANGLPRLRHPLFELDEFRLSTRNRFFLALEAGPEGADWIAAEGLLNDVGALTIWRVAP